MTDDPKCEAGCVSYYGGEKKHHRDCPYYPESLTKLNADRIEALLAERDALEAENKRLRERLANLPIREKDVNRALVLFRTSNNAHGFINFHSLMSRIDRLPEVARNELAGLMFAVAYGIDADEVIQRAAALKGDKT